MENEYILEILIQGNCPALVPGTWFSDGQAKLLVWDTGGLIDLYKAAAGFHTPRGQEHSLPFVLDLVRKALFSVYTAEDWLIPDEMLDISPGGAWLDPVSDLVRFRLRENASDPETAGSLAAQLAERICSASGIPSAGVAAGKIKDAAASGASVKDLISLVCSLRLLTRMI